MSSTPTRKTPLAAHIIRKLAVESPADPRSIVKLQRGEPLSPLTRERIIRALEARGLAHLVPNSPDNTGNAR
jgi:hypothetical protein